MKPSICTLQNIVKGTTDPRSYSEPERARVCQRVAVRASVRVTESHRELERDRERSSKSQREPVKA